MDAASKYDAAAQEAACAFFLSAGTGAISAAAWSAVTGGPVGWGVAAAIAGVSGLSYALGCGPDWDNGDRPAPESNACWKVTVAGQLEACLKSDPQSCATLDTDVTEIKSVVEISPGPGLRTEITYVKNGVETVQQIFQPIDTNTFSIRTTGECTYTGTPDTFPPEPVVPPYEWTDPDDGCKITANFLGYWVDGGGNPSTVWKLEPSPAPATASVRASGSIIGGCNFAPVVKVYYPPGGGGGGGNGGPTIPWNPGPTGPGGIPWWVEVLLDLASGVITNVITAELYRYFGQPLPAFSREVLAPCQYDAEGNRETFTVTFPEQDYTARMLSWQDSHVSFMQQFANWKTPTCSGGGSSVTGDAVSINWVSDEYSLNGNDRIRKLLTYFDQVGSTLEQTVAHWKDFTWNAGSVIVSVNGVPLGKPQVWAESADEGKRVINHAAAIAGVDMSKAEWLITSPRSSRYGQTGLMRVHRSENGILGITKRNGPSGSPMGLG